MNIADIRPLALPSLSLTESRNLPSCSAIYFVIQGSDILYIGKAKNLHRRLQGHHIWRLLYNMGGEPQVAWLECNRPELMPEIEKALITHFKPLLNRRDVKGDKKKKFTVTVPDSVFEDLEILADTQGRPTANLAAFLIELGIKQIKESGELRAKKTVKEKN